LDGKRKRIGKLDTAMSIASENGKVYKEMRRGLIDPAFAAKLSTVLMNQRAIVETTTIEAQIAELEAALLCAGRSTAFADGHDASKGQAIIADLSAPGS
jgi:hypothetical protein